MHASHKHQRRVGHRGRAENEDNYVRQTKWCIRLVRLTFTLLMASLLTRVLGYSGPVCQDTEQTIRKLGSAPFWLYCWCVPK